MVWEEFLEIKELLFDVQKTISVINSKNISSLAGRLSETDRINSLVVTLGVLKESDFIDVTFRYLANERVLAGIKNELLTLKQKYAQKSM